MTDSEKTKKNPTFGKIMLASGVGTLIVLTLIGIFKLLVFFGIVGSLSSDKTTVVQENSFLKIDLTKPVYERAPGELQSMFNNSIDYGFIDILRSISKAANDDKIKGIYLYMGNSFPYSWGKSEELRQALKNFRNSEKPVLVYADAYTQQGYFVASAADSIYLNPSGMIEFSGIGAQSMFFKQLLDKLAVKMTLVRPKSNSFKSAGETYTMDHMSDFNRRQIREYIISIWDYAVAQIGDSRDISTEQLNTLADDLAACLPDDAVNNGLIDRLCFESDIKASMIDNYGMKHVVDISEYVQNTKPDMLEKQQIAVIYAEGDVVDGTGVGTAVYSDNITNALNEAADNDKIKAIVLRVNSPGGQVTASEKMTNAVMRAKQKKPVIVSMGDVAASAGYEISCNANFIVAEPTTVTGSIGVFATIPEIGATLKKYLGITSDTVNTNTNSTSLSILRPMSPKVLELMQRNVEEFYTVFVDRVAKGRGLDNSFVDSIARGRVWTGRDALKLGLVDALGGLDDAISIAADSAGISKYAVIDYPAADNFLDKLMNQRKKTSGTINNSNYNNQTAGQIAIPFAGDGVWMSYSRMLENLNRICETKGLQARVEFFLIDE
ncbi:MAG: signal peptide peptidase SppA [Bacteroidales bacterium]|nr:signal peptide peptidase SppA [Bacteroidales bacterium]